MVAQELGRISDPLAALLNIRVRDNRREAMMVADFSSYSWFSFDNFSWIDGEIPMIDKEL